ncbi:hypothetical protein [Deinococcus sp. UYEF24]
MSAFISAISRRCEAMLSLAGVPPLAGFAGKVLLFTPALSAGLS